MTKLCTWFDVRRRPVYYTPTKSAPKLDEKFVVPIKALIEEEPPFGYRTVAWHLSRSGKATTAVSALEHSLIAKFGTLGKVDAPFLLRSELPMIAPMVRATLATG